MRSEASCVSVTGARRQACAAREQQRVSLHLQHSLSSPAQVPKSGDPTGTHCASWASTTPTNKPRSWTSSLSLLPFVPLPMTAIIDPQRGHTDRPLRRLPGLYHSLGRVFPSVETGDRHATQSTNVCSLGGSYAAVAATSWICDRIDARASRFCLREPAARRRWAVCGPST